MHSSMADPSKRIFTQSLGRRNKPDKFNVGDIVYITCCLLYTSDAADE